MSSRNIWFGVLSFLFCFLGSILLGFMSFGVLIFEPTQTYFQFVVAGAVCGALIVAINAFGYKSLAIVAPFVYAAVLAITKSASGWFYFRDAVWVAGLILAVCIGLWNNRLFPRLPLGKFVLWGATFGVMQMVMIIILALLNGNPIDQAITMAQMRIGVLIGLGVGLGFELAEFTKYRLSKIKI